MAANTQLTHLVTGEGRRVIDLPPEQLEVSNTYAIVETFDNYRIRYEAPSLEELIKLYNAHQTAATGGK